MAYKNSNEIVSLKHFPWFGNDGRIFLYLLDYNQIA